MAGKQNWASFGSAVSATGSVVGAPSGFRNQFKVDQLEPYQMVPVVEQHVTQQGAQIVEEITAGNQVPAQGEIWLIEPFQQGVEQENQPVEGSA